MTIGKEKIINQLYHWLEDDRNRRSLVICADNCEIWWASLRIDDRPIIGRSGNDFYEVLTEVLEGMIIREPTGKESEL